MQILKFPLSMFNSQVVKSLVNTGADMAVVSLDVVKQLGVDMIISTIRQRMLEEESYQLKVK